jgi:hypothetical protein
MRTLILSLVAVGALLLPIAAMADSTPTAASLANQICKQEQTTLKAAFASTYGTNATKSNAFGKCVAKNEANAAKALASASNSCKTEQAADPKAFLAKYGTNGNDGSKGAARNALGKCISTLAKAKANAAAGAAPSARATCKASAKSDAAAYAAKYGTGRDALGKCVASLAHAK